jgi:hypothetical protein
MANKQECDMRAQAIKTVVATKVSADVDALDKAWDKYLRDGGYPGSGKADNFASSNYRSRERNPNKKRVGFITYGILHSVAPSYTHIEVYGVARTIGDVAIDLPALSFLPDYAALTKLSAKAVEVSVKMAYIRAEHTQLHLHPEMEVQLLVKDSHKFGPFSPMRYDFDGKLTTEQKAVGKEFKRLCKLYDRQTKAISDMLEETLLPLLNRRFPNRA